MIYLVYFYLVWSSIADFFIKAGLPLISYIDEFIVLILLVHLIFGKKCNPNFPVPITKRVWTILVISFLSMLVNLASPVGGIQFIFSILKPVIVFYWIVRFASREKLLQFANKYLVFLIIFQIPFFIFGLLTKGSGYTGDYVTGATITGDAHQVGIYMWLGVVMCTAYYFTTKQKKYLYFLFVCLTMLLFTSSKQIIILLPFVIILLLYHQLHLTVKKIILFAVVFGVLGYYLFKSTETLWVSQVGGNYEEEDYYAMVEGSEKIKGYYSAIFELPDELPFPLLGAGPGQYGSYVGMAARTHLSQKYIMYYNDLVPEGLGGTLTYRSSGLIGIYGDIGIIGLILFLSIYISTIKISTSYAKLPITLFDRAAAFLVTACGILILTESLLQNVFEGNWFILNYFWVLSGCIFIKMKRNIPVNGKYA